MLRLIKLYYQIFSLLSPRRAATSAFEVFQKVRKKDIRKREQVFFEEASHFKLDFEGEDLDCYEFGRGNKDLVILVHGWDSNAGCMYGFIEGLLKENKRILSFNLPAHAFYKASKTNIFVCKNAFKTLLSNLPEHDSLSIISHSFGSGISAYALSESDMKVDQLVFLTSPNIIMDIFHDFQTMIGLGNMSFRYLAEKADRLLGEKLSDLKMGEKLALVDFKHLHLIHDRKDKVIPFRNTEGIAKAVPNSSITAFERVGHYRMLWNEEVIAKVISAVAS